MRDRLPLELVQHIVFLALPSSSSFTKYRERQDPLLALCLTSRALRALAQPLLFEWVNLESKEANNSFLEVVEANKALGERVKALRLSADTTDRNDDDPVDVVRIAKSCPRIVEIVLFRWRALMEEFEAFPYLTKLAISHSELRGPSAFRLPRLEELSLVCSSFRDATELCPASFPKLEALHNHCDELADPGVDCLESFRPHVLALSCDAVDHVYDDPSLEKGLLQVMLHDCDTGAIKEFAATEKADQLHHLRLNPFAGDPGISDAVLDLGIVEQTLNRLVTTLSTEVTEMSLPNLAAVYLPRSFRGQRLRVLDVAQAHAGFERLCTSRNVELIFEDLPHPYYDSFISPEFVKRCKATKAKERAETRQDAQEWDKVRADRREGTDKAMRYHTACSHCNSVAFFRSLIRIGQKQGKERKRNERLLLRLQTYGVGRSSCCFILQSMNNGFEGSGEGE